MRDAGSAAMGETRRYIARTALVFRCNYIVTMPGCVFHIHLPHTGSKFPARQVVAKAYFKGVTTANFTFCSLAKNSAEV